MSDTRIYPIDTDGLSKGSVIPSQEIASICHHTPGTDAYALFCLKLREYIQARFAERNEIITVVGERNALRILTDAEASEYNRDQFKRRSKQMVGIHVRACGVDVTALNEDQQKDHEHTIMRQATVLSHMREGWKAKLITHERTTPRIGEAENINHDRT